jgi:hypothetical protein
MWRPITAILGATVVLCMPLRLAYSAPEVLKESAIAQVDKQIGDINGILKKLYRETAKAKEENDIHRYNCLLTKLNLVKGLVKASERAKGVLMDAFYGGDTDTSKIYLKKVNSYAESAKEVERSLSECAGVKTIGEGASLVYIRPEGEELQPGDQSPWDWEFVPGQEGYPAVPPASPFR